MNKTKIYSKKQYYEVGLGTATLPDTGFWKHYPTPTGWRTLNANNENSHFWHFPQQLISSDATIKLWHEYIISIPVVLNLTDIPINGDKFIIFNELNATNTKVIIGDNVIFCNEPTTQYVFTYRNGSWDTLKNSVMKMAVKNRLDFQHPDNSQYYLLI